MLFLRLIWIGFAVFLPPSYADYQTVNGLPQFSADENQFSLYWSVWRNLSSEEKKVLGTKGSLISHRTLSWQIFDCKTKELINENGEDFWYLDKIQFDSEQKIIPILEAQRPDYLYLNLANFNSLHAKGLGPFLVPSREMGENWSNYQDRKKESYRQQRKARSIFGIYGTLIAKNYHQLYGAEAPVKDINFKSTEDYRSESSPFYYSFLPFSPDRWPVYYDERAHKPHDLKEPSVVSIHYPVISSSQFRMKLHFDACDSLQELKANLEIAKGELPPPGPSRAGRPETGLTPIVIKEIFWNE